MNEGKPKDNRKRKSIFVSIAGAFKNFATAIPLFLGIILLLGLLKTFVPPKIISAVFRGKIFTDTIFGSVFGSLSAGNPVTSYIIGGELLRQGISLFAVTAFIVAWVTVGVIQLPAEAAILGKKFAILRNILSFVLSIAVAIATVMTLELVL